MDTRPAQLPKNAVIDPLDPKQREQSDWQALEAHILNKLGMGKTDAQYITALCRELDIKPLLGIHGIYSVKGKPFMSATLKRAIIINAGHTFMPISMTPDECVIRSGRKGQETFDFRFSRAYANATGRIKSGSAWVSDPMSMCLNACTHLVARTLFSDLFFGFSEDPELAFPERAEPTQANTLKLSELAAEKAANNEGIQDANS